MKRKQFPEIRFQNGLALYLAAAVLFLPIPWLAGALMAALFHELCHVAALVLLGHPVKTIYICISGARITTEPLPAPDELVCALAGPLGALLLLPFARWIPTACLFAFVQSLYNMIPIYPMDGGRVFRSFLSLMGAPVKTYAVLENLVCSAVLAAGVWMSFRFDLGVVPLFVGLCVVFPALCKK